MPVDKLVETSSSFKNFGKTKSQYKNKTKQSDNPPTVPKQSKANVEEMQTPARQLGIEIIVNKCGVPESLLSANEMSPGHVGQFTRIPLELKQNCRKDDQVSYHGTAFDSVKEIIVNGYDKDANPSRLYMPKKVRYGKGIYTSPNLRFCKNIWYAETFEYKGRHYQLVLETKVSMAKTTVHDKNIFKTTEKDHIKVTAILIRDATEDPFTLEGIVFQKAVEESENAKKRKLEDCDNDESPLKRLNMRREDTLVICSLNVHHWTDKEGNDNRHEVMKLILTETDPDVICLQECKISTQGILNLKNLVNRGTDVLILVQLP